MLLNWRVWVHGLGSAFIGGAAGAVATSIAVPELIQREDWIACVARVFLISGTISCMAYLKTSPLPAIKTGETQRFMKNAKDQVHIIGCLLLALFLFPGCAFQRTVDKRSENKEGKTDDKTTYVGISWFNKTAVNGLKVGSRSDTNSTTLSLDASSTETQGEAIEAAGKALGAGIAKGITGAIVP